MNVCLTAHRSQTASPNQGCCCSVDWSAELPDECGNAAAQVVLLQRDLADALASLKAERERVADLEAVQVRVHWEPWASLVAKRVWEAGAELFCLLPASSDRCSEETPSSPSMAVLLLRQKPAPCSSVKEDSAQQEDIATC